MIAWLVLLSSGSMAHAADAEVQLDPFTLAAGQLPVSSGELPAAGEVRVVDVLYDGVVQGSFPCSLQIGPTGVSRAGAAESCPLLWTVLLDGQQDGTIGLRFAHEGRVVTADAPLPRATVAPVSLQGNEVRGAALAGTAMALPHPTLGWTTLPIQDGVVRLDAETASLANAGEVLGFVRSDAGLVALDNTSADVDAPVARPVEPVVTQIEGRTRRAADSRERDRSWCPGPESQELVVCWDTTAAKPEVVASSSRQVINSGTEVTVYVRYVEGTSFRVSQQGEVGLDEPGIREESEYLSRSDGLAIHTTKVPFAPRKAGEATVELELEGTTYRYELIVQKTYAGALRTGIGFAFGGALDASYASARSPGSEQAEVIATSRGGVDVELVVGFAPYLDKGGRAADGCAQLQRCFAPYVGVGIVAPRASGIDVLTSVHAGVEWEPVKTFSIAGTAAIRRTTRLADGVQVGSPVVGEPPTTEGWGVGVGIVLNVSPEFFKVASKGVL